MFGAAIQEQIEGRVLFQFVVDKDQAEHKLTSFLKGQILLIALDELALKGGQLVNYICQPKLIRPRVIKDLINKVSSVEYFGLKAAIKKMKTYPPDGKRLGNLNHEETGFMLLVLDRRVLGGVLDFDVDFLVNDNDGDGELGYLLELLDEQVEDVGVLEELLQLFYCLFGDWVLACFLVG